MREGRRGFYARVAVEGVAYARGAEYEYENGFKERQGVGGAGYGLLLMLGGSPSRDFAIGGAVVLQHIPSAVVTRNDESVDSALESVVSFGVGPSVDYYPSKAFHLGGLIGIQAESIPPFNPASRAADGAVGSMAALWLGFDWEVGEDLGLGILLKGQIASVTRSMGEPDPERGGEGALSLGLGVTLVYF